MAKGLPAKTLKIISVNAAQAADDYRVVNILTERGEVKGRYYKNSGDRLAVLFVGGVGGGFDSPADDLYPKLATSLLDEGIASLRVCFRKSTDLEESVLDVMAGLQVLEGDGMRSLALVGHSFGGAVVIQAASAFPSVRTVVTLAAQSYGASAVSTLGPRCSILLLHGAEDKILPPVCSQHLYANAREPKRLTIYEGATHCLDEVASEVREKVRAWLVGRLYEQDVEDWRWGLGTEGPAIRE
jgi:dienelactone hydrolase